jgi:cytochrome c oxidase subunit IV
MTNDQSSIIKERHRGHAMSEQAHPTTGTYLRVAAILVMVTLIEVGVFYVPAFRQVLVPVLLVLSAFKFTLVVMFYMHLKFDNRFFAFLFGGPLLLALAVVVSLLFLFYGALRLRAGS